MGELEDFSDKLNSRWNKKTFKALGKLQKPGIIVL
jgi:hypothetical protein